MNKAKYNPLVSVVIPFYKNAEWLYEAIDSVANQTYKSIEIIIVNDGSIESIDLSHYASLTIRYYFQQNKGAAAARNFGISVSNGDFIAFLDSDDKWKNDKIEKQVEFLKNHEDCAWVHCSYQTFGNEGKMRVVDVAKEEGMIFPKCLKTLHIGTPCVMIRKKLLNSNAQFRFNETMKYGEDFFLWVSISQKFKIGVINDVLCYVRMHGNNAAKSVYALLKSRADFKRKSNHIIDWDLIDKNINEAYCLCEKRIAVIEKCKFLKNKPRLTELVSRVLYLRPYLKLHKKDKNEN